MRRRIALPAALIGLAAVSITTGDVGAQTQQGMIQDASETVRVFLDCRIRDCDRDYIQTEVAYVDWVRDRLDADVYLLITSESAGGGGFSYSLDFLGQGNFAGMADTLVYVSRQDETDDETRSELVRTLELGLVPFLMQTRAGARLNVRYTVPEGEGTPGSLRQDPWDYWVFSFRLSGNIEGERSRKQNEIDGSFSARRVTPRWKTSIFASGNYGDDRRTLSDGETFRRFSHRVYGSLTLVKALGPHWSVGLRNNLSSSTSVNEEFSMRMAPAVEYSMFPYSEFTRRQFTIQYSVGGKYFNYEEQTIYGKWAENRYNQSLVFQYEMKQPWGSASLSLEGSHYFEDLNQFRLDLRTNWDVRLFRGFSLNINADASRIRDQIYLSAAELDNEDILLRILRLETGYDYNVRVGLTFTFGSIFNTVVNPRLDEVRRGFGPGS